MIGLKAKLRSEIFEGVLEGGTIEFITKEHSALAIYKPCVCVAMASV